jgi:hypothetical protein
MGSLIVVEHVTSKLGDQVDHMVLGSSWNVSINLALSDVPRRNA